MAHRTIVGIDVGTTKVCTIVAQVQENGRANILGVGLTPSKGLDKGVVVNIDDAVNAIATSVEKAERLSGYRIGTAFVGVAGRHISSLNSRGVVAVARNDHEITRSDIARAVEAAQAVAIPNPARSDPCDPARLCRRWPRGHPRPDRDVGLPARSRDPYRHRRGRWRSRT